MNLIENETKNVVATCLHGGHLFGTYYIAVLDWGGQVPVLKVVTLEWGGMEQGHYLASYATVTVDWLGHHKTNDWLLKLLDALSIRGTWILSSWEERYMWPNEVTPQMVADL